jgi:Ca-activated chloride channel family protein
VTDGVALWTGGLPLLLLAPLAAAALVIAERGRSARLLRVAGAREHRALAQGRPWIRPALAAGGLLCALAALLRPAWGASDESVEQRGADIVVCLDVSRSMLAQDAAPNRLEAAKREIRELTEQGRGDRFALVLFAGEARLAVPLTADAGTFAQLAAQADTLSIARGGTDLGAALETAARALRGRSGEGAAVLLLTDGDDAGGRGLRAAAAFRERGVSVHCVGFGTERGAKIGVDGAAFLRDRGGREVVSVMDAASLRRIAEATGGSFVDAAATPHALATLHDERLAPLARTAYAADEGRGLTPRFQVPLLAAFLLWILHLWLAPRPTR